MRQTLPTNAIPSHYSLSLIPSLQSQVFSGICSISLAIKASTTVITANALQLKIKRGFLVLFKDIIPAWKRDAKSGRSVQNAIDIVLDEELETVSFQFKLEIPAGSNVLLHIEYEGCHNDQMVGFYRSSYINQDGNQKYLVSTHFEPSHARKAFPCFDQPDLKATFEICLIIDKNLTGISNMHLSEESTVEVNGSVKKKLVFANTPVMSTYLVAFVVGELEYLESIATPKIGNPITIKTFTLTGQKEMGRFALETAVKVLEYFAEYYDYAYPLGLMQLIAIPDFKIGAMENWGLITFRQLRLLFVEGKSSSSLKWRIAYVVAHELAHQWFGNLVTMEWWSDLWLKEGFATAVGWQAIDHIFPEWDAMNIFLKQKYESGLQLDALVSTHPICVDVAKPADVSQIFDAISYNKGASLIRMLSGYIGEDSFRAGVNSYLKKHAYGNASTNNLWAALKASSGKDISSMMSNWTLESGFPLLVVEDQVYNVENRDMTITVSQKRFLASGETLSTGTFWFVPISIRAGDKISVLELKTKSEKITFSCENEEPWILDDGCTGFFRIRYSDHQLKIIGKHIQHSPSFFSTRDKFSLLSDCFNCFKTGLLPVSTLLEFLKCFQGEKDCYVVEKLIDCLNDLKRLFYLQPDIINGLNKFLRELVEPLISTVGHTWPENESFRETLLRTLVLQTASAVKVESVLAEFYKDYWKFLCREPNAINSNIRTAVLSSVLRHSPTSMETFNQLLAVYESSRDLEERQNIFLAMASSNDPQVLLKYLSLISDPSLVRSQDINSSLYAISHYSPLGQAAFEMRWDWFTSNFSNLQKRFVSDDLPIRGCMEGLIGDGFIKKIEEWIDNHKSDLVGVAREVQQELEVMKQNTALYERNCLALSQWLSSHVI